MKRALDLESLASDPRVHLGFLTFFSVAVFFSKLGMNGMANYDDCFYAQQSKEILQTGNWTVLTYNHVASFSNAPLLNWSMALSYKIFGVGVYAAKFPSALLGLCAVLLLYLVGKELFDPRTAFFSGAILATTYPFFKYARHAMMDVPLTCFTILAMAGLVWALRRDRKFFWLWGLAIGLCVLTKSLLGFFPFLVTALFLLLTRRWKTLGDPHFLGGTALFLSMTGAWVWSQCAFPGHGFIDEHLGNIIMHKVAGKDPQAWTEHLSYLKDLATYYWPWLPLAVYGLYLLARRPGGNRDAAILILVWSFSLLGAMSLIQVRHVWYLIPSFPAMALAGAYALDRLLSERVKARVVPMTMAIGTALALCLITMPFALDKDRERDIRIIAPYVKHFGGQGAKIVAFRGSFHGFNNSLLFFSDYAVEKPLKDPGEVGNIFKTPALVLCLVHRGDQAELEGKLREWYPVRSAEDLCVISNKRLDLSDVNTWEGPWEN